MDERASLAGRLDVEMGPRRTTDVGTHATATASYKRRPLRRRLAIIVVALALPVVAGCGANFGAQTNIPYQPAEGISDRSSAVEAINTLVVTDGQGHGTVVSALINQVEKTDTLVSVKGTDDKGQPLNVTKTSAITLPYLTTVQLANSGDLRVQSDNLQPGYHVWLTFTFKNAAPVRVQIPVVMQGPEYVDVPVGAVHKDDNDRSPSHGKK
ncbi:MAG: hypothetical protein ACRDP4_08155 [Nocardioidaceae bacterium]